MTDIKKLRDLYEKTPKETIGYRSDHDYYQGGTYIGVGPLRYLKKGETGFKIPVPLVPVPMEQAEYFKKDLCRIEDDDFGDFIIEAHRQIPALLDEIESLRDRNEAIELSLKANFKKYTESIDRYKKALDKCKEQRDKRKSQLAMISGRTLKPSQVDHSLFVYTDDEELEQILKRSEDD